jgi:hypothetical protein
MTVSFGEAADALADRPLRQADAVRGHAEMVLHGRARNARDAKDAAPGSCPVEIRRAREPTDPIIPLRMPEHVFNRLGIDIAQRLRRADRARTLAQGRHSATRRGCKGVPSLSCRRSGAESLGSETDLLELECLLSNVEALSHQVDDLMASSPVTARRAPLPLCNAAWWWPRLMASAWRRLLRCPPPPTPRTTACSQRPSTTVRPARGRVSGIRDSHSESVSDGFFYDGTRSRLKALSDGSGIGQGGRASPPSPPPWYRR